MHRFLYRQWANQNTILLLPDVFSKVFLSLGCGQNQIANSGTVEVQAEKTEVCN